MRISDWSSDVCSSDLDQMAGRRSRHSTQPRTKYCASIPCLHPLRRELDCGSEFVQQPSCRPGLVERTKPHRGPVLSDFRAPPFFSYRTYHSFCIRSEEQTYELQSLMRNSYAVFFLKKKKKKHQI